MVKGELCSRGDLKWQASFFQTLLERLPIDILHNEVMNPVLFANVVERADVRVVQAADGLSFALESFTQIRAVGQMLREDFDRNRAVEASVGGAIHFSHTARTELVGDFVWA